MNLLFVNHTSRKGGGELSMLDLLGVLPAGFEPTVACPEGELAVAVAKLGVCVSPIVEISGSLRLHPVHTPVAIAQASRATLQVARAARRTGTDLIVANSIRAGIICVLAGGVVGRPTVVHLRDCLPRGRVPDNIRRLIGGRAAIVVANSHYTAASFAAGSAITAGVRVAYSEVDLRRFDPARVDRSRARQNLDIAPADRAIGVIGQITPWKGQDTALEAVALLRASGHPVKLLVVGEPKFVNRATRYDNLAYLETLRRMVVDLDLEDSVRFLGQSEDVAEILVALDTVLVPSWEEPFGRIVVEAMAVGTPAIATDVGGPAEIIEDGQTGLLVPPRDPRALAAAANRLLECPKLHRRLEEEGRRAASGFGLRTHVASVVDAYRDALALQA